MKGEGIILNGKEVVMIYGKASSHRLSFIILRDVKEMNS